MKTFLCVSSEKKQLKFLMSVAGKYDKEALVVGKDNSDDALYETDTREIGAVLTVPKEKSFDGLTFARKVHEISPNTKVIFVSDKPDEAVSAFRTRASGYLVKADEKAIFEELDDLGIGADKKSKVKARAFGNFDLFVNGKPVKFYRAKSKEMLAYLIYRRGTGVSASELIVNLWEDKDVDRTTRSMFHNVLSDLKRSLIDAGAERILLCERNCYRVANEEIECEYFDYLDGKESAKDLFIGEFMYGYEWAEYALGDLERVRSSREGRY